MTQNTSILETVLSTNSWSDTDKHKRY